MAESADLWYYIVKRCMRRTIALNRSHVLDGFKVWSMYRFRRGLSGDDHSTHWRRKNGSTAIHWNNVGCDMRNGSFLGGDFNEYLCRKFVL